MPLLAWLFFLLMIPYGGSVLWRAWKHKHFKYGPLIYSLDGDPIYFWFFAFVFTAAELFLVGLFGLAVASLIWGPFFHQ